MTTMTDRKNAAISRGVGMTTQIYADRAENSEIWDKDGNRYIDFAAGIAVVNTGHRHPRVVEAVKADIPQGMNISVPYNPTEFVAASVESVQHTLLEAVVLVVIVVMVFLQTWRAAIIPIIAIPIALVGTFAVQLALGYSINSLSLFALVLAVCAHVGLGVLTALGYYIALQCTLYIAITLLMYGVAVVVARERLPRFAAALLPVQAIAASTQSSLASLPVMVDSARQRLGYPLAVTSLVLPMAVSLFRIASPTQYLSVVVFIAWVYGVELGPAQLAVAVGLSIVISMGSVGLPGQVSFMTNNLPVTQAMGLPVEPLGVLLAVDTIPDVFATVANTSGQVTATAVVARRGGTGDPLEPGDAP